MSGENGIQKWLPEKDSACFRCGVCCQKYQVRLSQNEAEYIADRLGLSRDDFISWYTDARWPGVGSFLLRHSNGACIFLRHTEGSNLTTCFINSFKPAPCLDWTAGLHQGECQEGLARYWGLTVGPSGEIQGSNESIKQFQNFFRVT